MNKHLLVGCSFTDPMWQSVIPWSVQFAKSYPSYIIAKAGMGIKGIASSTIQYLNSSISPYNITHCIIILPTLWRIDVPVDTESYLCSAMVDCLYVSNDGISIEIEGQLKWLISGGLHYNKKTEEAILFDFLYKHQGFLEILKEQVYYLKMLISILKKYKIKYYISAIQDPKTQLIGLEYLNDQINELLTSIEYETWFKFDNGFINDFLGHSNHPNNEEHKLINEYIIENII